MKGKRLTTKELHDLFVNDLGECAIKLQENTNEKPIHIHLGSPFNRDLKAFIFNCTNPKGSKMEGEYKIQLRAPGQKKGERGHFDLSDGITTFLMGYAVPLKSGHRGVWVIFDIKKHLEFAHSANVQIYFNPIMQSLREDIATYRKSNNEIAVLSSRKNLQRAVQKRLEIDLKNMLETAGTKPTSKKKKGA